MKEHLQEIRKKQEATLRENSVVTSKYNCLLAENEELTQLINSLKSEHQTTRTQGSWDSEEQIAQLRQDLRQVQTSKEASGERALNFEKQLNEYILKFNDLQGNFSQCQINYYRLQKDNDNLKIDRDDLQQKLAALTPQLEVERAIHADELQRLRLRARRDGVCSREEVFRSWQLDGSQNDSVEMHDPSRELTSLRAENAKLQDKQEQEVQKWEDYVCELIRKQNQRNEDLLAVCKQECQDQLDKVDSQL